MSSAVSGSSAPDVRHLEGAVREFAAASDRASKTLIRLTRWLIVLTVVLTAVAILQVVLLFTD